MQRSYADMASENTPKPEFHEVVMKAAWACAGSGEEFTKQHLTNALVAEWGVSTQLAESWLSGVKVLSDYMLADVSGDALDEERSAVEASRAATRPMLEARFQLRLDQTDQE